MRPFGGFLVEGHDEDGGFVRADKVAEDNCGLIGIGLRDFPELGTERVQPFAGGGDEFCVGGDLPARSE